MRCCGKEQARNKTSLREWRWVGYTLRKPDSNITRDRHYNGTLNEGKMRKRRQPTNSWRRGVESEMKKWDGHTWGTLRSLVRDRSRSLRDKSIFKKVKNMDAESDTTQSDFFLMWTLFRLAKPAFCRYNENFTLGSVFMLHIFANIENT